jgi:hypothetical protein
MIVASTTYESVLLILKVAFLVLLYLFIWRIVRTAGRDLRRRRASSCGRRWPAGRSDSRSDRDGSS